MAIRVCCEVCGNEIDVESSQCPYCDAVVESSFGVQGPQQKTVNLERGMPLVGEALARLGREIEQAGRERCRVLTLIHGYGSSGRGGAIRQEVRAQLQYLKHRGVINDMLAGEEFSTRTNFSRRLLHRFPFLRRHRDLNRSNPGITLVIL
jgi:hypothetical protein